MEQMNETQKPVEQTPGQQKRAVFSMSDFASEPSDQENIVYKSAKEHKSALKQMYREEKLYRKEVRRKEKQRREDARLAEIERRKQARLDEIARRESVKEEEEKLREEAKKELARGSVVNGVYIPKVPFVFPKDTDTQIIEVDHKRKVKVTKKYYDFLTSGIFKLGQFFYKISFTLIAHNLCRIRYHLKVEGKENLKPYKKQFRKNGFITVSNHVFIWDFVALCASMRMGLPNVPAWGKIIYSKFGSIFTLAGVIPIPEDKATFRKFYRFVDDILKHNKRNPWMHIYPETGLWSYYAPIRPFKKGAATFAYQYNKPIIPIGYSFRERTGISKLWHKRHPYVTVHICPPIWPDKTNKKQDEIERLTNEARMAIMHAVGIKDEEENQRLMKDYYKYEDGHYYTKL